MRLFVALVALALLKHAPARPVTDWEQDASLPGLASRLQLPSQVSRDGLSFAVCKKTVADCRSPRICVQTAPEPTPVRTCSAKSTTCLCMQTDSSKFTCTSSSTCDVGERCVRSPSGPSAFCVACEMAQRSNTLDENLVDDGNCGVSTIVPKPFASNATASTATATNSSTASTTEAPVTTEERTTESVTTTTVAAEPTVTEESSSEESTNVQATNATGNENNAEETPMPAQTTDATEPEEDGTTSGTPIPEGTTTETTTSTETSVSESDTETAEASTEPTTSTSTSTGSSSWSPNAPPALEPPISDSDAVCIAASALSHLPPSALVFRQHRKAPALCDEAGSCATAGHVVVFRGRPMMMQTYCADHARCVRRRMLVNSPKLLGRGQRVPSPTHGLDFTPFAARFRTRAEEHVLRALVRVGF